MLINEVSKFTGLTKKAIEYYTMKGLVAPNVLENGYRDYNQKDINKLKKISVLRKLDISIDDIKAILSDESGDVLKIIAVKKELDFQREDYKRTILNKLSSGANYSVVSAELKGLDNSKTITEKLLEVFPGYYGRFICLHFARFLNQPITRDKQRIAYDKIISFLDNINIPRLPDELEEYLSGATNDIGIGQITEFAENIKENVENPENFLANNKEFIEQYIEYKLSDEYKNSPIGKIAEVTKEFNKLSGYNDVFISAMKELSDSYSEYYSHLEDANKKLIELYPQAEKI